MYTDSFEVFFFLQVRVRKKVGRFVSVIIGIGRRELLHTSRGENKC